MEKTGQFETEFKAPVERGFRLPPGTNLLLQDLENPKILSRLIAQWNREEILPQFQEAKKRIPHLQEHRLTQEDVKGIIAYFYDPYLRKQYMESDPNAQRAEMFSQSNTLKHYLVYKFKKAS